MENAKYAIDLQRSPAVIYVFSQGLKYEVCLKDGSTSVEMAGNLYPVPGCPFPVELVSARFWAFMSMHTHGLIRVGVTVAALIVLQICLMVFIGGNFAAMSISYFSLFMNTTLCLLFCMVVLAYCGKKFLGNFEFTMFPDKEEVKLLDIGQVSIGADIPVFSLIEDEAAESFEARMRKAMEVAGDEKWVVVMPFKNHMTSIYMGIRPDGETVDAVTFLRHIPFVEGPFTEKQVFDAMQFSKQQSFSDYMAYCRGFADEYITWSAAEKMPKYSPFETIVSTMKASATCLVLLLFSFSPLNAQKTEQVKTYLGDRAEMPTPTGKEVSFIFEKREISVISQGKDYVQTLQGIPFFQDKQDAGKLLLIKVGGEKILPKSLAKRETASAIANPESARPIPEDTQGESFLERLPDSSELQVMKSEHLKNKALEWHSIRPVLDYYMWRFWGLMVILFGVGGAMWVLAKVSAKDSIKDLHGNAFIGNAITQMHIMTKTFLFCIMAVPTVVIILDDCIRAYYTSVFGFWFVVKYAAVYWVWQWAFEKILPDSPGQRTSNIGGYPVNNHRQLNG